MTNSTNNIQQALHFFYKGEEPTIEELQSEISAENPACPLSEFKGNPEAMRRIERACRAACLDPMHRMPQSLAMLGPASTGKSSLTKLIARTVQLPLAVIQPKSVKTLLDLLAKINDALNEPFETEDGPVKIELVANGNKIKLPPMFVMLEEVHAFSDSIIQGLLTAVEANDGMMDTGKWLVDCTNVCWVAATTDRGLLFQPFDTRFTKIFLEPYTRQQVAEIIHSRNKDWSMDVCMLIAKYSGRVVREGLAFAEEMRTEIKTTGSTPEKAVEAIRRDHKIDEHGLSFQRVTILTELAKGGPISKNNMVTIAGCEEEELEKFIMPILKMNSVDQPAMVRTTSRGYEITPAGIEQLKLRGIVPQA